MSLMGTLPIMLVGLTCLTFIVSYVIAVARGDIYAAFPYISDTGSETPESNIFGQFLNIAACLALGTMFCHYKAVQAIVGDINEDPWICKLNKWAIGTGLFSCLGVSIVANFQEGTIVEPVHFVGAIMTFTLGIVYCFLESALSYQMHPCFNTLRICRIRLVISFIATVSLVISLVSAVFAFHQWNKSDHTKKERLRWSSADPGYDSHVVSTVFEWVTTLVFFTFFLTYVKELNKFTLEVKAKPVTRNVQEYSESNQEANERTRLIL